jgi:hypothetical protein
VLHLKCLSKTADLIGPLSHRPVVVGSLLKHENKISLLHFDVMKHNELVPKTQFVVVFHVLGFLSFLEPVASGEPLIAFFGLRRLFVSPLFSQHVPGCDKCKFRIIPFFFRFFFTKK